MSHRLALPLLLCLLCCNTVAAQPSYTLAALIDSALANNLSIRNARRNIEDARLQRRQAFTNYFPTVSGTAMTFAANRDMAKMDIDPSEFITPELGASLAQALPVEALAALSSPMTMTMMKNGTIAGINAVLPVFTGGQIINGNRLARIAEQASELQLQLTHNDIERQTTEYFCQLLALDEKRRTLDAADSLLTAIAADAETAVEAGVALRNDLLQVQLRQNDIASQRLRLDNGTTLLRLIIAQFCGLNLTPAPSPSGEGGNYSFNVVVPDMSQQDYSLPSPFGEGPGVGASAGMEPGVRQLPEYQLLQKQVDATRLQYKMAVGKNLPSLAVGAGYNYHNLLDNDRHFGMVFATLSLPVTDWWNGSLDMRRKRLARQQAQEQLDDNAQLLAIRQTKATNDVVEAQNQLQLAARSIEQARENLRIHTDTYHAGTATMSDLLEAQLLLQQAQDSYTDAATTLLQRQVALCHATGTSVR